MAVKEQLDAKKTGWGVNFSTMFKDFDAFKPWFDARYKNMKAEEVWKMTGGTLPEKKKNKE